MIRPANRDDWDKIHEVLEDAVERQKNGNPLIAWTMDTIKKENILDDFPIEDFFIAFDDLEPVGIIAVTDEHQRVYPHIGKGQSLYVRWFVVKRKAKGSNVAQTLLNLAINSSLKRRLPLRLETNRFNKKLVQYYKSKGFVEDGRYFDEKWRAHQQLFLYKSEV